MWDDLRLCVIPGLEWRGITVRTMETPQEGPRRGFGLSIATCAVIASMVGTGILISPGYLMASLGSYLAVFRLWTLGGSLAMCGAL